MRPLFETIKLKGQSYPLFVDPIFNDIHMYALWNDFLFYILLFSFDKKYCKVTPNYHLKFHLELDAAQMEK